jgi:hypothetical protein
LAAFTHFAEAIAAAAQLRTISARRVCRPALPPKRGATFGRLPRFTRKMIATRSARLVFVPLDLQNGCRQWRNNFLV